MSEMNAGRSAKKLEERLQGTLFLSSMMGRTDGAYCAHRGRGAGMVQLGAYLAAAPDQYEEVRSKQPEYFLPQNEKEMEEFFRRELTAVREALGEVVVALNIGVFDLEQGLRSARAWEKAGGEIFELNVHGDWKNASRDGFLRGMALDEHQPRLLEWAEALAGECDLMIKFHREIDTDFKALLEKLETFDLLGYHFNIRSENEEPDVDFAAEMREHAAGVLICSGHVRQPGQVYRLFAVGVDSVGFADPVREQGEFIARMRDKIRE